MAVTNLQPTANEAGIRLEDALAFQWTAYDGAGNLLTVRVLVYSDAGGAVLVWDSLAREPLAGTCGDGWLETHIALVGGTDYWWKATWTDDTPATGTSSLTKFTTAAADVSASTWAGAQP